MKYSLIALAAATTALASGHHGGMKHSAHADMFSKYDAPSAPAGGDYAPSSLAAPSGDCPHAEKVCTTYTTSRVHAVTKYYNKPESTVTVIPVYESKPAYTTIHETPSYAVPIPIETTCPTPGVYIIPAKTITLEHTYSTAIPVYTTLTPGCNTYGGVTTIVKHATTVTCPYAAVETCSDGTVTSKITSTTYVCPTPGTYTIAASTTTIDKAAEVTCVVPATYTPGTYVHPEQTITVTKTSQVVYCPYETAKPTPKAPEYPKPEAPKYTHEAPKPEAPKYTPVAPEHTYEVPKPQSPKYTPVAPKHTYKAPKPKSPKYTPEKPSGHGLWSIAYSPFNDDHSCKSKEAIVADLADISKKGFENVRVYSTECDTLEYVGSACEAHSMKLIVGIFFKGGISSGDSQVADLLAWDRWDLVSMVIVGNESVFNSVCTAQELGQYIKQVGDKFRGAGYKGSVTTTETLGVYQQSGVADALCPYMDVIGVNVQPYFNGARTAEQAGEFMKGQLELTEAICPGGKTGYILEAGWPSGGQCNGVACPGKSQQATAVKGMAAAVPGRVNFFTYRNDGWKEPGAHGIEDKFGCGDLF